MNIRFLCIVIAIALLCAFPVSAQQPSNANGRVVDQEGNPVQGAVVSFHPVGGKFEYKGKTNKKGKYFIDGLINSNNDKWTITFEGEGVLPVKFRIESRTVNRVLIGDVMEQSMKPGASIPEIVIKPLGSATVDLTVGSAEQVLAAAKAAAEENAIEKLVVVDDEGKRQTVQSKDPWDAALEAVAGGDLSGAVGSFDEAVEKAPDDPQRREVYAKVLYQLERHDEAETQARKAVELAPEGVDARMVLYSIAVARGDMTGAKAELDAALEVSPNDIRVLEQQAYVANQTGAIDDAIVAYEAITAAAPENSDAWVSLGGLYAGKGDSAKSAAAYQRVVELEPKDAHRVFYNLGALIMNDPERKDVDVKRAVGLFEKALEYKPDYAHAHKQLAFALLGTGDRAGAKSSLESYVQYAPDAPDAAQMQALLKGLK
ncbi:MAG: tetratricopeptide repeat protein [bacterium]|nr:tetratricopeptide repeat protein [bacterium]